MERQKRCSNRIELYSWQSQWHNCKWWSVALVPVCWDSWKMATPCSCPRGTCSWTPVTSPRAGSPGSVGTDSHQDINWEALMQSLSLLVESPGPRGTSCMALPQSSQTELSPGQAGHTDVSTRGLWTAPATCLSYICHLEQPQSCSQPWVMQCPASGCCAKGNALWTGSIRAGQESRRKHRGGGSTCTSVLWTAHHILLDIREVGLNTVLQNMHKEVIPWGGQFTAGNLEKHCSRV